MRLGESSIEQRPDTRICAVQRISNGVKECEGDGCQRKSEAVEKVNFSMSADSVSHGTNTRICSKNSIIPLGKGGCRLQTYFLRVAL